jgi:hypothetical protein
MSPPIQSLKVNKSSCLAQIVLCWSEFLESQLRVASGSASRYERRRRHMVDRRQFGKSSMG